MLFRPATDVQNSCFSYILAHDDGNLAAAKADGADDASGVAPPSTSGSPPPTKPPPIRNANFGGRRPHGLRSLQGYKDHGISGAKGRDKALRWMRLPDAAQRRSSW